MLHEKSVCFTPESRHSARQLKESAMCNSNDKLAAQAPCHREARLHSRMATRLRGHSTNE